MFQAQKVVIILLLFSCIICETCRGKEEATCPDGDLTGDCIVDMADITFLARNWLSDEYNLNSFSQTSDNWQMIGPSVVVITEIFYKPDVKTLPLEFLELFNSSEYDIDISGWKFTDGIDYTFPEGSHIAGDSYLIVAQDKETLISYYGLASSTVYGPYSGKLSNSGEEITLETKYGNIVDYIDYGVGFPWPTMAAGEGASIELAHALADNNISGNWRCSGYTTGVYAGSPTPGAANTVSARTVSQIPPAIRKVQNQPEMPEPNEEVVITAKITDPDGIDEVLLKYQLVLPGNYIPVTLPNYPSTYPETAANQDYLDDSNWQTLPMNDNGINGDIAAGDNIYSVTIAPVLQTHRSLFRYKIRARDMAGNTASVPYLDDEQPNFAYFTYDNVPSWSGAINPASSNSQERQEITFDSNTMSSLPVLHLIARNTDIVNCQYNQSYDNSSYYFSGTLIYNGKIYDNIHFRIRGQYSTFQWGKNKWKIKFNTTRDFTGTDIYGMEYAEPVDTLNLGSGTCPWWMYPHPYGSWDQGAGGMVMNEMLAYRLYQLAGAAASNTSYTQLRIIDDAIEASDTNQYEGDFWGLYIMLEHADGSFLDERDMPDGNIYRMDSGYNQTHQCDSQVDDGSDINELLYNLNYTNPSEQWWRDNINLDHYYLTRAIGIAVNDSDRRVDANCIYYHNSQTNKWRYIPWDLDLTFEAGGHHPSENWENIQKCLQYEDIMIEYQNSGREIADLLFNGNQTSQLIDELAALIYNGTDSSFVNAERAMWDYHLRVSSRYKGKWYKNNEFLTSDNFAGMVQYMKQSVSPEGFTSWGSEFSNFGVPALLAEVDNVSPALPETPTIVYTGPDGFPLDDLTFAVSDYNSSAGLAFEKIAWRIAEVEPEESTPGNGQKKYEINANWLEVAPTFSNEKAIPPSVLTVQATYRVRCKMMDRNGRWSHWSAPIEFKAGQQQGGDLVAAYLRVSELMYHPADPTVQEASLGYDDEKHFEYIELVNTSSDITLDVSALTISSGITFSFSNSNIRRIAPGEHILLVNNEDAFNFRYQPSVDLIVAGEYDSSLSNSGETIALANNGTVFISFTYNDDWLVESDGKGYSMEVSPTAIETETNGSLNSADGWVLSSQPGGSPGE